MRAEIICIMSIVEEIRFGTDGWRGIIGFDLTFNKLIAISEAIRLFLCENKLDGKPIVLSHDTRFLAPEFCAQIANYLSSKGCEVCLLEGYTPTPVTAFAVLHLKASGAIALTASHNPYYYLGVKFIPHFGGPAESDTTGRISEIVNSLLMENFTAPELPDVYKGKRLNLKEEYFNQLEKLVNGAIIKSLHARVLYSPFYGCGQGYVSGFLNRFGVEVRRLHLGRDVQFGGFLPDPSPKNMKLLLPFLREEGLELGVATDGDADRFAIITQEGQYFSVNQILPLLADFLITTRRAEGSLARTIVTSHLLDDVAKEHHVELLETPVGFKYVGKCLREGALIGGEESGGMSIKGHVPEKDGILSILLTLEMIATSGMKLLELYENLTRRSNHYHYERIDIRLTEEEANNLLHKVEGFSEGSSAFGERISSVNSIDGYKILLASGSWVVFRKSGTENVVRVYFEAKNEASFKRLKNELKRFLKESVPGKGAHNFY